MFSLPSGLLYRQIFPLNQVVFDDSVPQFPLSHLSDALKNQNQLPLIIKGGKLRRCINLITDFLLEVGDMKYVVNLVFCGYL